MKKALVPTDGSDNSLRAVAYAAEAARENPSLQIELLHVLDPMALRTNAVMTQAEIRQLNSSEAEGALRHAREVLDRAGVSYQSNYRVGAAATEIAAHAGEKGCDAVIMGTRGMGPIPNVVIGSVATRVVQLVDVPVVLVK